MPEEIKGGQPQSWWQTLPGTLTAIAGILTALTGLIVAISQLGPTWKTQPTGTAAFSGGMAQRGAISAVSFPLSEIRIIDTLPSGERDLSYKILSGSLVRSTKISDYVTLTFVVRITNNGHGYVAVGARFFRLLTKDDVIAPEDSVLTQFFDATSSPATVTFSLPKATKNAQLQVGEVDQKTVRIPLSLKIESN